MLSGSIYVQAQIEVEPIHHMELVFQMDTFARPAA